MWLTFVSGFFEILQGVQELKSGREIANGQMDPAIQNIASARHLSLVNICVIFLLLITLLLQLFYILFVLCILSQLGLISSALNHLRSATREIRKESRQNF